VTQLHHQAPAINESINVTQTICGLDLLAPCRITTSVKIDYKQIFQFFQNVQFSLEAIVIDLDEFESGWAASAVSSQCAGVHRTETTGSNQRIFSDLRLSIIKFKT
jgi:hypothetical protein